MFPLNKRCFKNQWNLSSNHLNNLGAIIIINSEKGMMTFALWTIFFSLHLLAKQETVSKNWFHNIYSDVWEIKVNSVK